MASNLRAADILGIDWESRSRDMQPRETPAEPRGVLAYWPGGTFRLEPAEVPRKNVLTDPDSWLNRGLSNLAGNVADLVMGRESGNSLVDLGAANVPGVGPAAILAAGGIPGLLDIAGAGELKNAAKIPKYTMEFVLKHFGERGLKNLDNALTKYPKAGKPSVNDAVYLMKSGLGGEQVSAIAPYSTSNALNDIDAAFGKPRGTMIENTRDLYKQAISDTPQYRKLLDDAIRLFETGVDENDFKKIMSGHAVIANINAHSDYPNLEKQLRTHLTNPRDFGYTVQMEKVKAETPEIYEQVRRVKELADSPVQDWGTIVKKQEVQDARAAEKAIKKSAKQQPVKPAAKQEAPKETRAIEVAPDPTPATPVVVPEVSPVEPVKVGGPNKWRENGWKSSQYSPNFFERFGSRLDENSKRDLFVLDSLKNHWVRQLGDPENLGFSTADILNGLERADARHTKTNYDRISREFRKDIERNMESGNMPGTAIQFLQKYKNNLPVEGKVTPTLILRTDEKPKVFMNTRIWADEAEGPDLYELLFRPAVDRKLNSLNPRYWEY